MTRKDDRELLYAKLSQAKRLASGAVDPLTRERLQALADGIAEQLAAAEARDTDAPPE